MREQPRSRRILPNAGTALVAGALVLAFSAMPVGQQPAPPSTPVFKSSVNLVLVDVVVRDRSGAVVKDLKREDFELLEDGVRQQIVTFATEEISNNAAPVSTTATLSAAAKAPSRASASGSGAAAPPAATDSSRSGSEPVPLTSEDVSGHRLITLLFDTSSMQPEDVQKAADSAMKWVDEQMSPADLVAVASVGSTLQVLGDFTSNKEDVHRILSSFSAAEGTAFAAVDASTSATDEAANNATDDSTTVDQSAQELDTFNNDVRLRALKTLADALKPIQQ
jgi:VWFA-related protein